MFHSTVSDFKTALNRTFRPYPWSFMASLIIAMLIPKFYELTNTFWVGHISFPALAISEQYEFLAVTIEIVNETIPFGILALVSQNYRDRERVISVLMAGLVIQSLFSVALMSIVVAFTPQFVAAIGTPDEIVSLTVRYLALKSIALPFESVGIVLLIAIKALRRGREVIGLVLMSVLLNMALDLFLISDTPFSMRLGLDGVAIGYVVSKVVLFSASLAIVIKILSVDLAGLRRAPWRDKVAPLFRIGGWTGLDSLVRNAGYILVPLGVLNAIGVDEFGGYGLAMTVMWTAIIPVLALQEGTNVLVGNLYGEGRRSEIRNAIVSSLLLAMVYMGCLAIVGAFYWRPLSEFFNMNPAMVHYSVEAFKLLILPYCAFAASMMLRSVFFGTGKTKYIFATSFILNTMLIFPYWGLFKLGAIQVTFNSLMSLFVLIFMLDLLLTYAFLRLSFLKRA